MGEFPPDGSQEEELRRASANAENAEQNLSPWNRTEGDYTHAEGDLNLREQQEMRTNVEKIAKATAKTAENSDTSLDEDQRHTDELRGVREEIKRMDGQN